MGSGSRASASNTITSSSSTTSPILIQNLSSGTSYSCYILTYLDGAYGSTSSALSVTTSTTVSIPSDYAFYLYVSSSTFPTKDNTNTYTITGSTTSSYSSGSNTYNISSCSISAFTFNSSYSICVWQYETTASNGGWYFKNSSSNMGPLIWSSNGDVMFSATFNSGGYVSINSYIHSSNAYAHWVFTYNGSTGKFYRNGVLKVSGTMTGSTQSSQTWSLTPFSYAANYFMLYNRELSATEISNIYTLQNNF